MGKLFDDIQSKSARHGNKSKLLSILEDLGSEDRKDLLDALDNHSIPASNIRKALGDRGYKLDDGVINRYRRGDLATDLHELI